MTKDGGGIKGEKGKVPREIIIDERTLISVEVTPSWGSPARTALSKLSIGRVE